ncbi:hypothetical protein [Nonomuraea fuscirosea]|uniref:hypothetical protein n=1 Tax=Nonomuraea fuscirosea TaxID=1291556 RepID=UPI0033DA7696
MIARYLSGPVPRYGVFRARIGLAVADLAASAGHDAASLAYTRLIGEAIAAGDGYAARDVLADDGCRARLTGVEQQALADAAQAAGLGLGPFPASHKWLNCSRPCRWP